jgi:hypothetical protein
LARAVALFFSQPERGRKASRNLRSPHVRIERTAKEMQIYVLKVVNPDSLKLHPGADASQISGGDGNLSLVNAPISDLENFGTRIPGRPVIDATGLMGG